ncbi:MAG: hydantoinase B/oxoprolinase family protein [Steroidobacteraceae bacterium]
MVDVVTAEIVRNFMESTAAEVVQSLVRSAVSPIFNEAHDCSAGIFFFDGETAQIIARADATPVHIYGALTSVQACLDFFEGDLNPGDVILVSDPYYGGTHIADFTVVTPVFYDGQPMFFPSVRAHMLDSGGPSPSGFSVNSREIWHEGLRFAPMKLVEKGEMRQEVWDLLIRNTRLPETAKGDLNAMVGACAIGEERIRAICDRYGLATIRDCVHWTFDYSERMFRERIRSWPNGTYRAESTLDTDFAGRHDLTVRTAVTVKDDSIEVDFAGTDPQSQGIVNSVPGNTMSYVFTVFASLCPDIPINSGLFRAISANLPFGSLVNPAAPACAAYATICIGCDIGDAVMKACEQFVPDKAGTVSIDLCLWWSYGVDDRTGQFFIHYDYNKSPVSAGGVKGQDGWGAWAPPFCALTLPSVEVTEVQYPCLYRRFEMTTDSAAPGQWRGAPGMVCEREVRHAATPVLNQAWIQALRHPLHGYAGGCPGSGNLAVMLPGTDHEQLVPEISFENPPMRNGDRSLIDKGGGGGWGDPLDRDVEAVLLDVVDEYVSVEGARHDYGVVIDENGKSVNTEATTRERQRLRKARSGTDWTALGRQQLLQRACIPRQRSQEQNHA